MLGPRVSARNTIVSSSALTSMVQSGKYWICFSSSIMQLLIFVGNSVMWQFNSPLTKSDKGRWSHNCLQFRLASLNAHRAITKCPKMYI